MSDELGTITKALEHFRGDDLLRARAAFKGLTAEQMAAPYGCSGKTRAEILRGYQEHNDRIDAAMMWALAKAKR